MNKIEIAENNFNNGCNCAQAVLLAFTDEKLPSDTLMLLSSGFGGGILQQGNTCGAVTGAIMALGLNRGYTLDNKETQKSKLVDLGKEFLRKFNQQYGTTDCRDLIKYDLSIPDEMKLASESNVFKELCPGFVKSAAEILSYMIKN